MNGQKIRQYEQVTIGKNIIKVRLSHKIGQTDPVRKLQLLGVPFTREALAKTERGIRHVQLRAIKPCPKQAVTSC